ncbi:hypothetical protein HY251_06320 [bacterium]|nr:hypothetical protein [bacterium]
MRRALAPFLVLFLAAAGAFAYLRVRPAQVGGSGGAWDLSRKAVSRVGDRFFQEVTRTQARTLKDVRSEFRPGSDDETTSMAWRGAFEVGAVTSVGRPTAVTVKLESWRLLLPDQSRDSCLEGRTATARDIGSAGATLTLDPPVPVPSGHAQGFLDNVIARKSPLSPDDESGEVDAVFPTAPVAEGAEWKIDPDPINEKVFGGTPYLADQSTGKGKLVRVYMEDGVRMATVDATLTIKHTQVPEVPMEWTTGEGDGVAHVHIVSDRSLEPEKRDARTWKLDFSLAGIGLRTQEEKSFFYRVHISVREVRKRGPLAAPPR